MRDATTKLSATKPNNLLHTKNKNTTQMRAHRANNALSEVGGRVGGRIWHISSDQVVESVEWPCAFHMRECVHTLNSDRVNVRPGRCLFSFVCCVCVSGRIGDKRATVPL